MKKLSVFVRCRRSPCALVRAGRSHCGSCGGSGSLGNDCVPPQRWRTGTWFCWLVRDQGGRERPSTSHAQRLRYRLFEWAPDGSRIAYLDRRGALWLVRPDGTGRVLLAASSPLRNPWVLSWSPDGKAIAVVASDPNTVPPPKNSAEQLRIYVISTGGGAPRRLPSGDVIEFDWSPQGDEIAYGDGTGRQRIIRTDGSKPRPFFPRPQTRGKGLPTWSPDGAHVGFVGRRFGAGASPTAIPGSMLQTRTGASFTSSRAMPTTSTGSPGRRTGGGFSTAGQTARAST